MQPTLIDSRECRDSCQCASVVVGVWLTRDTNPPPAPKEKEEKKEGG